MVSMPALVGSDPEEEIIVSVANQGTSARLLQEGEVVAELPFGIIDFIDSVKGLTYRFFNPNNFKIYVEEDVYASYVAKTCPDLKDTTKEKQMQNLMNALSNLEISNANYEVSSKEEDVWVGNENAEGLYAIEKKEERRRLEEGGESTDSDNTGLTSEAVEDCEQEIIDSIVASLEKKAKNTKAYADKLETILRISFNEKTGVYTKENIV